MAQFIVRNLEDDVTLRLKQRAASRGRSMEEEVRRILRESVRDELTSVPLGTRMAARFEGLGFEGGLPEMRGSDAVAADFEPPTITTAKRTPAKLAFTKSPASKRVSASRKAAIEPPVKARRKR